jgi:hypothetical protein
MGILIEALLNGVLFGLGYYLGMRRQAKAVRGVVAEGHPVQVRRQVSRRQPKAMDDKRAWELEQKNPER